MAVDWWIKAIAKGEGASMRNLGVAYAHGDGVAKDVIKALMWYTLASKYATGSDVYNSKEAYHELAKQMTPAQIAEAKRLAAEWKPEKQ